MIEKDGNWNDRSWKKLEEKKRTGSETQRKKGRCRKRGKEEEEEEKAWRWWGKLVERKRGRNEIKARADERGPMAGISPTIGSAQHPMIRRRLRLAEVRMSALDGLTLLPFPRLPCDTNSRRGCIADTGRGIWPSSDVSIERSFFFFIFFI